MNRTAGFLVSSESEEDRAIPGPYIPTFGYPASACDMYRVAKVVVSGHEGWNSCYTDVATCMGLAKLVEGQITSWADVEAAETALQILFWHDRVDVMVPAFKTHHGSLTSYTRCDPPRSKLAFDLFRPCAPYDVIFAVEAVEIRDGKIKRSNIKGSSAVGKKLDWVKSNYLRIAPTQAAILSAIPSELRVPAYFNDPYLQKYQGKRGFSGKFYQTIRAQWNDAARLIPDVEFDIRLPPLLSIVLSRAANRNSIPDAIQEVRDEIANVRRELVTFSDIVIGSTGESDIEEHCRCIQASFEQTFPASRQPKESVLLPLLRLYKHVKSPLEAAITFLNPRYQPSDPHIIANRTITGKMFTALLVTDSMHSMLRRFFTDAEITALERDKHAPV